MFAGAAREAVFSRPDAIRRINADFIPVALKAALVNNPPDDGEGRLYREIGRSKPAPQGICVANSSGKVLTWALSFDDDASVVKFLDHALERYRAFPDASKPVAAERYMRFPGTKFADRPDTRRTLAIPAVHADGCACPAKPRRVAGTLVAKLVGRTLDADGKPTAKTVSQEHYVEDVFDVPPSLQEGFITDLAAGNERVRIPDALARLFVTYAYLGQLDVRPLSSPVPGHRVERDRIELFAEATDTPGLLRIRGTSDIAGGLIRPRSDGATHRHEIKLRWDGFVRVAEERIVDLVLAGRGSEKLQWGNVRQRLERSASDVTRLPAGRPIDLETFVHYGIVAKPIDASEVCSPEEAARAPLQAGPQRGPTPEAMQRVERSLRRLHRAVHGLVQDGKVDEAVTLLEKALELLEDR